MVKEGKYKEALEIIMEDLPLPGVLGRVCPHGCENACRRCEVDDPIAIRDLKRLAADMCDPREINVECAATREEKVAIIGSGPAGLSAAYHLARNGIKSVIYEALPQAGGMLRVGIPAHRLPREVLDKEIELVTNLGVEIKLNTPLGSDLTIDDLFSQGYKAVYLALGAHKGIELGIPNERAAGVCQGVDFLREANLTGKTDVGKKVAIIGGGNVAIDVARSAKRLGAGEVTILYRRTRTEMPAWEEEIQAAEDEGTIINYLTAPQEVLVQDGKVVGVRCIKMELGAPDSSGRRKPIPLPGSEFDLEIDQLVPAIGQRPDLSALDDVAGLDISRWGTTDVDPITYATGHEGVFAGGDLQTGPWVAIGAIAAGKEAAESIARYIDGIDMAKGREPITYDDPVYRPIPKDEKVSARAKMPELAIADRAGNFDEVELGYSEDVGKAEAARCVNCGYCCECYQCVDACGADAVTLITHAESTEVLELDVGSIIVAPGYQPFDPSKFDNYSYSKFENVVTSMEFERILSASGPTQGHLVRLGDHKEPKKIAWLQCIGSRDQNKCDNSYCSSVCCMYAIKEAAIAMEHSGDDLDCAIFYMDMRTHGKDFEKFYNRAQDSGVRFVRTRIHSIEEDDETKSLTLRYATEDGRIENEVFDMVVLSVGMETPDGVKDLADMLGIEMTSGNFAAAPTFAPYETSVDGIFACGAFQGPRDIPQSVVDASAAAAAAGEFLSDARGTQTKTKELIEETNIIGERPRIGVFICRCGTNIAGVVDVPSVVEYAKDLPYVEYYTDNLYSCSQDNQEAMVALIKEHNLNRVVLAACTPKTHEPLFQETLMDAGLNKYLFEMTNIRNHDSWVHKNNPEVATEKAKDLVRMAVMKVALMEALPEAELEINQTALVLGGGVAGMSAALSLADQGYETLLVEKNKELGGQALNLYKTVKNEDVQTELKGMISKVEGSPKVSVHLETTLDSVDGFVGNYKSKISRNGNSEDIEYGVAVVATGGNPYLPDEYSYGQDPRVLYSLELDKKLMANDPSIKDVNSAVFIQCVGSRNDDRPYCSRVCCTHSIHSAIELKELKPEMDVYILYRDIRAYGEREYLYREAREKGVFFIRYSVDNKPEVKTGDRLTITVIDHVLEKPVEIEADLLTLASAIVPNANETLSQFYKVPINDDGFFVEKHAKLGPTEFATDGVFLCGLAHYPKPVDESVAQGKGAASRAVTLLARKNISTSGQVARVKPDVCSTCGVCIAVCPYSASYFRAEDERFFPGKSEINPVLCKGCGLCVASCRSGAINLLGFGNDQVFSQIFAFNEAI